MKGAAWSTMTKFAVLASITACVERAPVQLDGAGIATPDTSWPRGYEGGACYPDYTCNAGLICTGGICTRGRVPPASDGPLPGTEGAPCRSDGTCNAGLTCVAGICVRNLLFEAGTDVLAAAHTYSTWVSMVEYTSLSASGVVRTLDITTEVSRPDPVIHPDFVDKPNPPNCVGYKWSKGGAPNRTAWDAGKLTIKGHKQVPYIDGDKPGPPQILPATITCLRKQIGTNGLFAYDCGLPPSTLLPAGSIYDPNTHLAFAATGGIDVGAFSEKGLSPGEAPKLDPTTDLTKIVPVKGLKVSWDNTTKAALVVIRIDAWLADGSEGAELTCMQITMIGSRDFPQGALALLPKPTASNPLFLKTSVAGTNAKGTLNAWGNYKVAAGQGTFGVTCLLPNGSFCP